MSVALRGTPTTASRASSGALVISVPAGVVSGDVLVVNVTVAGTVGAPAAPSGFTLLDSAALGPSYGTYYRVCDGTEGASFSWTLAAAGAGTMLAYSGVDNTTPINAHSLNRSTSQPNPSSITSSVDGCEIVFGAGTGAARASLSTATGFVSEALVLTNCATGQQDRLQATAGATGSVTASFSASGNNYASLIALAPAGAASINGDAAITLATPTTAAAGSVLVQGAGASTVAPVASGTGTVTSTGVNGAASIALAGPAATATGAVLIQGASAAHLTTPTVASAGALLVQGSATGSIAPALAASGVVLVQGTALGHLAATATGTGTVGFVPVNGDALLTLVLTVTGHGVVLVQGSATATFALSAQGDGTSGTPERVMVTGPFYSKKLGTWW